MGWAGTGTVSVKGQEVLGSKRKDFSIKCGFAKGLWILGTQRHWVQDLSEVRKGVFLWAATCSEILKPPLDLCLPAPWGTHGLKIPGLLWVPSCTSLLAGWRPAGWGATAGSRLLLGLLVVGARPWAAAMGGSPSAPGQEPLRIALLLCLQGSC